MPKPETTKRIQVWSSGGGTQSAAIAALICKGELKPDIAVIVDTEREVQTTWDYHDAVIVPALALVGVVLHRVPKSKYATVDLYGSGDKLLIPAFTNKNGSVGKLPTYCSNEWKARVVQRFCSDVMPEATDFDIWLGISRDESHRMRSGKLVGKWQYKHPLIDDKRLMSRKDCIALVESMGWPKPPRSRCWMCPNQGKAEWKDLMENSPLDFAKAVKFEVEIKKKDPNIMLRKGDDDDAQGDCMSGMCYV